MPSIRSLAEQLIISHNTVAKAYLELQHEGLLQLRHGSGAYISAAPSGTERSTKLLKAQSLVRDVVEDLCGDGFSVDEIRRLFEAQLSNYTATARRS